MRIGLLAGTETADGDAKSHWLTSRPTIAGLTMSASLFIWLVTVMGPKVPSNTPDSMQLIRHIAPTYWIGLLTLTIAFVSIAWSRPRPKIVYDLSFLTLLAVYLYGTPVVMYPNLKFLDVLDVVGRLNMVIQSGYISGNDVYPGQFPAAFALFSSISSLTTISSISIAKYYPLAFSIVTATIVYCIGRRIADHRGGFYAGTALLAFGGTSLGGPYSMVPFSVAFLAATYCIYTIVVVRKRASTRRIILLIFSGFIVISNPTVTAVMIGGLVMSAILLKVIRVLQSRETRSPIREYEREVTYFLALLSILYVIYSASRSEGALGSLVVIIRHDLLSITGVGGALVTDWTSSNPAQSYLLAYRVLLVRLVLVILMGFFFSLILIARRDREKSSVLCASFLIAFLGLQGFVVIAHDPTFFDRALSFTIMASSIVLGLAIPLLRNSPRNHIRYLVNCVGGVLVFCIFSMTIASGLTDPYNMISDQELAGREFIGSHNELPAFVYLAWASSYVGNVRINSFYELKSQNSSEYAATHPLPDADLILSTGGFTVSVPLDGWLRGGSPHEMTQTSIRPQQ